MEYDGSPRGDAVVEDRTKLQPYPPQSPPTGKADITLRFRATDAPDPENPFVTNCSLNGKTWQIWRNLMHPPAFDPKMDLPEDYPVERNLPLVGSHYLNPVAFFFLTNNSLRYRRAPRST
jgi:L-ascorbate oxidase